MKIIKPLFLIILLSSFLLGCAQMKQMAINNTCSKSNAYTVGVNDGRTNSEMRLDFASICPDNQDVYNEAYIKGYKFGLSQYSNKTNVNINNSSNGSNGHNNRGWGCIDSFSAKNGQVCGYGCMKGKFNKVYCGKTKQENCVKDSFGDVKCGVHCHVSSSGLEVVCDN
jgi:hypothetical protein